MKGCCREKSKFWNTTSDFSRAGGVAARLRALPIPESDVAPTYPSRFIAFERDSRTFLGTESNAEPTR